jgi:hypothetical protein
VTDTWIEEDAMAEEIANNRASKANAARRPHKDAPVDTRIAMAPATVTKSVWGKKHSDESASDRRASSEVNGNAGSIHSNLFTSETADEPAKLSNNKSADANIEVQPIHEPLFERELCEVSALIDFVSGRINGALRNLTIPHPDDPSKVMCSSAILRAINKMRYPPSGTSAANARNADILLLVREELSALSSPATPRTIAYTQLFTDAEGISWLSAIKKLFSRKPDADSDSPIDAAKTYPKLVAHAHRFRLWRDGLALFSLFWLLLTGIAYWDAGLGRAALERLDQNWKTLVDRTKANPALILCTPDQTEADRTKEMPVPNEEAIRTKFACLEHNYLRLVVETAGAQVDEVFRCVDMDFTRLMHVWCWDWLLSGPPGGSKSKQEEGRQIVHSAGQVPHYARVNVAIWQTATTILSVFTTYILPMMFALLGTMIGAFRAILNRIKSYELAPRDLVRMQIGIPTGLVAGIAVGLFLSPSSVPMQGAGAVSGQLTLTASGLGFLAGYASYSFFGFLDNLIQTAFPAGTPNPAVTPNALSIRAASQSAAAGLASLPSRLMRRSPRARASR